MALTFLPRSERQPRRPPDGSDRFKGDQWFGDGIHSAAEWADEQMETKMYVSILGRSLENGGTIAESTLGENLIFLDDLHQELARDKHRQRLKRDRHLLQQKRQEAARYAAWERGMQASRGHWTEYSDKKFMLLIRQDSEDSMAGLYIRVVNNRIDAGVYRGAAPDLGEADFERLWGKTALSPDAARSFVLNRAMGA